ncbi:MAG TPA: hypothetical protein VEH50_07820 [Methylomirabilota bacterium]|jgi:hypothetical protein|nr:hypothetical protein [Methylomirabilota bacterium]
MPKVIVTAQVQDAVKWEAGFRTHADFFKTFSIRKPVQYSVTAGNQTAVIFEPEDLATFMRVMESPATAQAMAFDGVKRETVKVFVLDKELAI